MRCAAYVLMLLVVVSVCWADQVVVTEDGRKVLLRDGGTWKYLKEGTQSPPAPVEKFAKKPAEPAATAPPQTAGGEKGVLPMTVVLIVSLVFLAVIGAILFYFLSIQPAKKRKLLGEAFEIIERNHEPEFPRAEEILQRAIVSGLKAGDVSEAYFALAYVRARLKKTKEAAVDLDNVRGDEPETVYFRLWLKVNLEEYKEAYEIAVKHDGVVERMPEAKKLASIACLHLGRDHWRAREIEAAVHYFDQVRKLGVHLDQVPKAISSHQVTLGILALFDKHYDEAEENFQSALEQAKKEKSSGLMAELGLLLCEWRKTDYPDVDDRLAGIVASMEKEMAAELSQPAKAPASGKETGESERTLLSEERLLLRNAFLWLAVSRIFLWLRRKEKSGLPDREREILRERLEKVSSVAPRMGDPLFLMGLVDYYFAYETHRETAVESLEKSGVKVPEAEIIAKREKKLIEYQRDTVRRFIVLLKKYLGDRAIPARLRKEVSDQLQRFSKFRSMAEEVSIGEEDDEVVATLKDIQARGEILHKRITGIMKTKLKDAGADVVARYSDLMAEINKTTRTLADSARRLETTEQQIMLSTGEFLLGEEEKPGTGESGGGR